MASLAAPLSFASDIRPLFRDSDVSAMIRFGGFDLSKYEDVRDNADHIYERLSDRTMPCDGPWRQADIDLFAQWITNGKQP